MKPGYRGTGSAFNARAASIASDAKHEEKQLALQGGRPQRKQQEQQEAERQHQKEQHRKSGKSSESNQNGNTIRKRSKTSYLGTRLGLRGPLRGRSAL